VGEQDHPSWVTRDHLRAARVTPMIERLTDMPAGTIGFRDLQQFAPDELDRAKAWVAGR